MVAPARKGKPKSWEEVARTVRIAEMLVLEYESRYVPSGVKANPTPVALLWATAERIAARTED